MKKYLLTLLLLMFIMILGCSEKEKEMKTDSTFENVEVSVSLKCVQGNRMNVCKDQQFNDLQSFEVFQMALKNANKMPGILNYLADYNLQVKFPDQTTKAFHLSLGTDTNMKGLLVNLENTNEGFEIPVVYANQLRQLIYVGMDKYE
ncbi:hypothetical protein [Paenibacillus sinopodophylli]|uniref:hypothetical protein n=1 Tax=Paenibacillus sinopodophylli TaxID=1837342 RepID=UPI00110C92EE|nr:hypothetical protein [Paenibacillus sinopodophylli]